MSLEIVAYVGPRYEPETSAYYFDFPNLLTRGSAMPAIATGSHTLASALADGGEEISITLDSTGLATSEDVPFAGGVWVGGNGTGQAWEYIQYSGVDAVGTYSVTLTGCIRESSVNREHNGIHTSGASVKFFWKLNTMSGGGFRYSLDMNDTDTVRDWGGETSGWVYPQAALRDLHTFIFLKRDVASDPFLIEIVGFLRAPKSVHDYTKSADWTVQITSASGVINRYKAPGVRRGAYNIARGAPVQSTAPLGAYWKERSSGDYTAAEPDLSARSAVDGDKNTLYISDQMIGSAPTIAQPTNDPSVPISDQFIISEVHLARATGQPKGYRYVEITAMADNLSFNEVYLATNDQAKSVNIGALLTTTITSGEKLVICENYELFSQENPSANPDYYIDLNKERLGYVLNDLSLAGGAIGLFWNDIANSHIWYHHIAWGTGDQAVIETDLVEYSPNWPGTTLAVTSNGQTYRYNWSNNATAANNWDIGYVQTVGYSLDNSVWMLLELPPLGLKLANDISSDFTGETTITDGNTETTMGLKDSDTIQIGDEILTYNNKTRKTINITARNVGGIPSAHSAGDPLYIYEPQLGTNGSPILGSETAVNALPVRGFEIICSGDVKINSYTMRIAQSSYRPRTPDQENYREDYDAYVTVINNTSATSIYDFLVERYVRYMLFEVNAMTESPARARVNEIRCFLNENYLPPQTFIDEYTEAGWLAYQILYLVGFPYDAVQVNDTAYSGEHSTAGRLAWDVLSAYAEYANLFISAERDSKITISQNGYWTGDVYDTVFTWTKSNARRVQPLLTPPEPVAQVKINWRSQTGNTTGAVVFPAQPDETGEIYELPERCYESAAVAQTVAEKIYWRKKYPYTWVVESSEAQPGLLPGLYHNLSGWQLNDEMQPINRLCMVRSVEHFIEQDEATHDIEWRTTVTLEEIQRFSA